MPLLLTRLLSLLLLVGAMLVLLERGLLPCACAPSERRPQACRQLLVLRAARASGLQGGPG
jgi:hypothetical protein